MKARHADPVTPLPTGGSVFKVNALLLYATGLGAIAYWIWPTSARDWGWGFISFLLAMAALATLIDGIKAAAKLIQQERAIARYLAQGGRPKTAEMASLDALKRAGMIEGHDR